MKKKIFVTIVLFASLTLSPLQAQTNKVTISRLDKDLHHYLQHSTKAEANKLLEKYPSLLPALSQTITNTSSTEKIFENLSSYFSHSVLKSIYNDELVKFSSLEDSELIILASKMNAEREIGPIRFPELSAHVSGFKENSIYVNDIISLSLDKYMGKDYSGYKGYFKPYQLQQMQPKMIARDYIKAWLMADFIKIESTSGDMLFEIIEHGKLIYALSILLPEYAENDLIGYTDQEFNWCINNNKKLWDAIIKQNHLYTTDRHIINLYFEEAPNNKAAVKGSPGQIGTWIGYQIVKQYAKETKQPLRAIISADAKLILKDAKYRP